MFGLQFAFHCTTLSPHLIIKYALILVMLWICNPIVGQPNYQYDSNGRLIADLSQGIKTITWNSHNRILEIVRTDTSHLPDVEFGYDAGGNRVYKVLKPRDGTGLLHQHTWRYIYYVYNQHGLLLATYQRKYRQTSPSQYTEDIAFIEHMIYAEDRQGYLVSDDQTGALVTRKFTSDDGGGVSFQQVEDLGIAFPPIQETNQLTFYGKKQFALSNVQGNAMVVVSDRKIAGKQQNTSHLEYFAEPLSLTDFYPFGAILPERNWNTHFNRFGFGSKEKDDEVSGEGNTYNFGARIYDSRIGKWLSQDPLWKKYPSYSPYAYVLNSPLMFNDPTGESAQYTVRRNSNGGGDIVIAATVYIENHGAEDVTTLYSEAINEYYKPGTYFSDKGELFTITFDVTVKSAPPGFTRGDLKPGENMLAVYPKEGRSVMFGDRIILYTNGRDREEIKKIMAHETGHMFLLSDRYMETSPVFNELVSPNDKHTPASRADIQLGKLQGDLMYSHQGYSLVLPDGQIKYIQPQLGQMHYNNIAQYILQRDKAEGILSSPVDLDHNGKLIGRPLTHNQERMRRSTIGAGMAAKKSSMATSLQNQVREKK